MLEEHRFLTSIDQYTEYPIQVPFVEERLAWMRNWSSWREFNFVGLQLRHVETIETERYAKTSFLAFESTVNADSLESAVKTTYTEATKKLNFLSLLTGKGFAPITIRVPRPLTRVEKRSNLVNRIYWWAVKRAEVKGSKEGKAEADSWPGERRHVVIDSPGYQHEEYEVVVDVRENGPKRELWSTTIDEVERRWRALTDTVNRLPPNTTSELTRALDLYRASRMSRDVFARYVVVWTALDSLTPYTDKMGKEKTDGMAKFMGPISGVAALPDVIGKLYGTRNDISHSRKQGEEFSGVCKNRLIMLEWIFLCYLHERLSLPQRPASGAPTIV